MTDPMIYLAVFCLGIIFGVIIVRYGIRIGSRLTISAQNNEPLDEKVIKAEIKPYTG